MISNYTALNGIMTALLEKDIDFQLSNTLNGDLDPVKQLNFKNYVCQCDLEDLTDGDIFIITKEEPTGEILETILHTPDEFMNAVINIIQKEQLFMEEDIVDKVLRELQKTEQFENWSYDDVKSFVVDEMEYNRDIIRLYHEGKSLEEITEIIDAGTWIFL